MNYIEMQIDVIKTLKNDSKVKCCENNTDIGVSIENGKAIGFIPREHFYLDVSCRFEEFKLEDICDFKRSYELAYFVDEWRKMSGRGYCRKVVTDSGWSSWVNERMYKKYFNYCIVSITDDALKPIILYSPAGELAGIMSSVTVS